MGIEIKVCFLFFYFISKRKFRRVFFTEIPFSIRRLKFYLKKREGTYLTKPVLLFAPPEPTCFVHIIKYRVQKESAFYLVAPTCLALSRYLMVSYGTWSTLGIFQTFCCYRQFIIKNYKFWTVLIGIDTENVELIIPSQKQKVTFSFH